MKSRLRDVQNLIDKRGIAIQKAGIKNVDIPLLIQRKGRENQIVSARARLSASLDSSYKGTHMSRFMEILNEWSEKELLGIDIKGCLEDTLEKLNAKSAQVKFSFKYFMEKTAPVSKQKSLMAYDCSFEGILDKDEYKFFLGVKVPVTTLCPCSKEISDFSAHNQRAMVKVLISYDDDNHIWLEDLIADIETKASCEVYPVLKREDEKYVTEKAYQNPKFVEDVLRDIVLMFRNNKVIKYYEVEVESIESIHNHEAWAYQVEVKEN
jgi:GTP cyclohydrolase I